MTPEEIAVLEAAVTEAKLHRAGIQQSYQIARDAASDAHNAALFQMDADFASESREAAQAVTAAQEALDLALNPPAEEPVEPEEE